MSSPRQLALGVIVLAVSLGGGTLVRAIDCPPCDDGNLCTTDTCDTFSGTCKHGDLCDDHNGCTLDSCNPGGQPVCTHFPLFNGASCDDGNPCTFGTRCFANVCGSALYTDTVCSDANACTGTDLCASGVCSGGAAANCDDGNPCTDDLCDAVLGCRHVDNTAPCDDGQACTTGDTCQAGACVGVSTCTCRDADADGQADCTVPGCTGVEFACGDCNDSDASVHSGAAEVCNHKDDNCDGRVDEGAATAWFTRKLTRPVPVAGEHFGSGVIPIGDVTGDGIIDLARGMPGADTPAGTDAGVVEILSGADGSTRCTAIDPGGHENDQLGRAIAGIGDLTGDGIPDIAAGARMKVTFISGADCSIVKSCTDSVFAVFDLSGGGQGAVQLYQNLGATVAAAGDLNHDSIPDVLVGDPDANFRANGGLQYTGSGRAVLFSGANCAPLFRFVGSGNRAQLGTAMAAIGDVTGDGVADIAIGAPQNGSGGGFITVYSGSTGAVIRTITSTFPASGFSGLGLSLDGGADLTGDGVPDIVSWERVPNPDGTSAGKIEIYSGSDGALARRCADPQAELNEGVFGPRLVGDLSGDGIPDVVTGSGSRDTAVGIDSGEIVLFSGSDCSIFDRLTDRKGGEAGQHLGGAFPAGDLNGDGWPDLVAGVGDDDEGGAADAGSIIFFMRESDCDGDGDGPAGGDCNDSDASVGPGHPEVCDGKDNDCDGLIDEGDPSLDSDGDGVTDCVDDCPFVPDPAQTDRDGDGLGDACDPCPADPQGDVDHDGLCCDVDNCCEVANASQTDTDGDGRGDACDICPRDPLDDADHDTVCGDVDNCPAASNQGQADSDGDGVGDACDNCPATANADQNPCACGICAPVDIAVDSGPPARQGSALVTWKTGIEHDIGGFNVVLLDNRGRRTQLNSALIPCKECISDLGASYAFFITKHRNAQNLFVEQVHLDGRVETFGPAARH
ncbi:MAG TPA: MopE-related protein [Patescibacteria group bacterium]|nr:MopE-related protein [Patescibacteria group bacterium]